MVSNALTPALSSQHQQTFVQSGLIFGKGLESGLGHQVVQRHTGSALPAVPVRYLPLDTDGRNLLIAEAIEQPCTEILIRLAKILSGQYCGAAAVQGYGK